MMIVMPMMLMSMWIRKGCAAECCHSDEDNANDADDNDADVDEDTERVCS